jgi:glyoxylase-like metal-dependent hydrolase (beta-lactamase superfamily II)
MKVTERIHAILWRDPYANNANTYLIEGTKRILVDPGHRQLFGHVEEYLAGLSMKPADIDVVLITHGHPDHLEAAALLAEMGATLLMGEREMEFIREMAPRYGVLFGEGVLEPQALLKEGDLEIGDTAMKVLHCPGHSPGSLCFFLAAEKALFTGDVIFEQGLGRTDLPGGNGSALKESIRRLAGLDAELLLPGHGNIVSGARAVKRNFETVEAYWFAYI